MLVCVREIVAYNDNLSRNKTNIYPLKYMYDMWFVLCEYFRNMYSWISGVLDCVVRADRVLFSATKSSDVNLRNRL